MSVIQDNSITSNNIQPASGQALTIKDEGGTASITVATNGEATFAENIKITNGKGIDFSAVSGSASGSASAVLDDYEEGTWTPVVKADTNTLSGFTSGVGSNIADYTRIGNICHLRFAYDNRTISGTNSGRIIIEGIPFAGVGVYAFSSCYLNYGVTKFSQENVVGFIVGGETRIQLVYQPANSNWGNATFGAIGSGSYGGLLITYYVA